jgi:hypothetical protein
LEGGGEGELRWALSGKRLTKECCGRDEGKRGGRRGRESTKQTRALFVVRLLSEVSTRGLSHKLQLLPEGEYAVTKCKQVKRESREDERAREEEVRRKEKRGKR